MPTPARCLPPVGSWTRAQARKAGTAVVPILQKGKLRHREYSVACPRPHGWQVARPRLDFKQAERRAWGRKVLDTHEWLCLLLRGVSVLTPHTGPVSWASRPGAPRSQPPTPSPQSVMEQSGGTPRRRGRESRGCECADLPTAEPLPQACHQAGRPPASRWREPRRGQAGGGPEAAVCLGGEHFRGPPARRPPQGGLPAWQTADVGGGRGRPGSRAHTGCHLGSGRGAGRAPETGLGLGPPLAWAGSQLGA